MQSGFTVVAVPDYLVQLQQRIPQAKRRVVVSAMIVRSGPQTRETLKSIIAAATRGVKVHVLGDSFTLHAASNSGLSPAEFKKVCQDTQELFAQIKQAGGTATWVGKIGLNPYKGRYHAKITVIDDEVYTFGGINFCDDRSASIDYMLRRTDATLADYLEQLVADNARNLPASDIELPLSNTMSLLFDAGLPGHSIIYERACELAKRAHTITYISQMCPSGALAKALNQTKTTYFFNRPQQSGFSVPALGQLVDAARGHIKNSYEGSAYVHAKLILYDMKDGTKALVSGSHNFSWRGVAFGTKEIALCSTDPGLWNQLHELVYKVATAD
jgi:phosphatidylserine/phosphatidylglycerophosphate/cardiolipin synthase-like enzyme